MSAAADAFQQANSLFVDENYEQALEWYNKAIELDAAIAEYYSKRAACFLKLKRFTGTSLPLCRTGIGDRMAARSSRHSRVQRLCKMPTLP